MPYFPKLTPASEPLPLAALADADLLLWHANYYANEINNYQSDIIAGLTDSLDHRSYQHSLAGLRAVADAYAARNITLVLRLTDNKIMLLHNA